MEVKRDLGAFGSEARQGRPREAPYDHVVFGDDWRRPRFAKVERDLAHDRAGADGRDPDRPARNFRGNLDRGMPRLDKVDVVRWRAAFD